METTTYPFIHHKSKSRHLENYLRSMKEGGYKIILLETAQVDDEDGFIIVHEYDPPPGHVPMPG